MKKILLLATTLILLTGISKAAKDEAATKSTNATSFDNKASVPAAATATTVSSISMADLIKENQALKTALTKVTTEKETLANQLDFSYNMHFATNSLYQAQMQKQEEDAKAQSSFAWMMHTVITKLNEMVSTQ